MQISCEKCATTYELDARLIPPGGAPVQCTRCGHVFTAWPGGTSAPGTQGSSASQSSAPEPAPPRTVIFGQGAQGAAGASPSGAEPDPEDAPPPRERTLVFGRLPTPAPSGAPGSGEAPGREGTMVFGRPAVPAPAPAPPARTQIFGAVTSSSPAPELPPAREKTIVFGQPAVPGPAPAQRPPSAAQAPSSASPSTTQIYGASAVAAAVARAAQAAQAAEAMVSQAPGRTTTQIFGNPAVPAPPPAVPPMAPLNAPVVTPDPVPRISTTRIYGKAEIEAMLQQANAPAPAAPEPTAAAPTAPAEPTATVPQSSDSIPVFWDEEPREPTLDPGLVPPRRTGERPRLGEMPPRRTGEHVAPADVQPRRTGEHPMIGAQEPRHTGERPAMGDVQPRRTGERPAMGDVQPRRTGERPAMGDVQPRRTGERPAMGDVPPRRTGERPALGDVPPRRTGERPALGEARPRRTGEHVPISLPPEGPPPLELGGLDASGSSADGSAELRARRRGRNVVILAVGLAVVLGTVAFIGYRIVSARMAGPPPEVLAAMDAAMSVLRKDDTASQENAIEQLTQIAQAQPQLIEPKANLTLALSLRLDDARLAVKRVELESERLNARMAKLQDEKSPSDWQSRVNVMLDQRQALLKELEPLTRKVDELDAQQGKAFTALPMQLPEKLPAREELALLRAQAVYYAVRGSDQAIIMAERYRSKGARDGWDAIAFAEYALNARVPPDTLAQAHVGLEGVITQDSAFMRAYVLSARISLQRKRYDLATNALDATIALNPAHELAPKLLAWTREVEALEAGEQ